MLVNRLLVTGFVACNFVFAGGALAADKVSSKPEPVDSTVMFKKIPNDSKSTGGVGDIFELPDILLPETDKTSGGVTKAAADKDKGKANSKDNAEVKDVKLPLSIVNIAIPTDGKDASAAANSGAVNVLDKKPGAKGAIAGARGQNEQARLTNLVDVTKFDVAGVSLGMDPEKVKEVTQKLGFGVTDVTYSIPNFLKWRYREMCEKHGVLVYEQKDRCVAELAAAKDQRYISAMVLEKPEYKEKLKVSFASKFNKNMAYRIEYILAGDYSLGTSARPVFLKRERRKDFWSRIFTKYGMPSDVTELLWTEGYDKPYLRTYMNMSTTGARIVLEDISIADSDTYYMYRENQMMPATSKFSF